MLFFILLNSTKKINSIPVLIILAISVLSSWSFEIKSSVATDSDVILYQKESLYGRLEAIKRQDSFLIVVNNTSIQSIINIKNKTSNLLYPHVIASCSAFIPKDARNKVLLVGLAGGALIKELNDLGFQHIDAVDIDHRMDHICKNILKYNDNDYSFFGNDGRQFVKSVNYKYDLIIVDVSADDQQPYHLYTKEAIKLYADHLNDEGVLVFNIIDFLDISPTSATERVGDGLLENGMTALLLKDIYNKDIRQYCIQNKIPHERIILGTKGKVFEKELGFDEINQCCRKYGFNRALISNFGSLSSKKTGLSKGAFLDDCPNMELMSYAKSKMFRSRFLK